MARLRDYTGYAEEERRRLVEANRRYNEICGGSLTVGRDTWREWKQCGAFTVCEGYV